MEDLIEDASIVYCTILDDNPQPPTLPQRPPEALSVGKSLLHFPKQPAISQNNNRCCRNTSLSKRSMALMFAIAFFAILSTVFAVMYFTIDKKDKTCSACVDRNDLDAKQRKTMNTTEQKCNCSNSACVDRNDLDTKQGKTMDPKEQKYSWKYVGSGCVGARDNGFLELLHPGPSVDIVAVKLVHINGSVGCRSAARSNWGCASADPHIIMTVTNSHNQILYPSLRMFKNNDKDPGWYILPGYNAHSPELIFADLGSPNYLKKGEKIRIWYSEDLHNFTEGDNHGKTCMRVYVFST